MKRFFNLLLGALAMLAVAMLSAFITMRLAIHGREVKVPNLAGLTLSEASRKASSLGLRLNLENRFYSADTPTGHVLAQTPGPNAAGVDRPRVSLLLSQPEEAPAQATFVMPSLTGLTLSAAAARVAATGLHIVSAEELSAPAPATSAPASTGAVPAAPTAGVSTGTVVAQTPPAGHRVAKGDAVRVSLVY